MIKLQWNFHIHKFNTANLLYTFRFVLFAEGPVNGNGNGNSNSGSGVNGYRNGNGNKGDGVNGSGNGNGNKGSGTNCNGNGNSNSGKNELVSKSYYQSYIKLTPAYLALFLILSGALDFLKVKLIINNCQYAYLMLFCSTHPPTALIQQIWCRLIQE